MEAMSESRIRHRSLLVWGYSRSEWARSYYTSYPVSNPRGDVNDLRQMSSSRFFPLYLRELNHTNPEYLNKESIRDESAQECLWLALSKTFSQRKHNDDADANKSLGISYSICLCNNSYSYTSWVLPYPLIVSANAQLCPSNCSSSFNSTPPSFVMTAIEYRSKLLASL